jgi:hypothetical protein
MGVLRWKGVGDGQGSVGWLVMHLKHVPNPSVLQRSSPRVAYRMRTMAAVRAHLRRVGAYLHRCDCSAADHLFEPMTGRCMSVPFVDSCVLCGVHCCWYIHRPSRYTKWYADEDPSVSLNSSLVTPSEHTHYGPSSRSFARSLSLPPASSCLCIRSPSQRACFAPQCGSRRGMVDHSTCVDAAKFGL